MAMLPVGFRSLYSMMGLFSSSIRAALPCRGNIDAATKGQVAKRQSLLEEKGSSDRNDMLAKFFESHHTKGEVSEFKIADIEQEYGIAMQVFMATLFTIANVKKISRFAGSDTTAIAMRAVVDGLLRNPTAYHHLQKKLDDAVADGRINVPVRYADAIKLPYFTACVKEGLRLHPSVGLHLPRHVPEGGCKIAGHYFPSGWRVGIKRCRPSLQHRDFWYGCSRVQSRAFADPRCCAYGCKYRLRFSVLRTDLVPRNTCSILEVERGLA